MRNKAVTVSALLGVAMLACSCAQSPSAARNSDRIVLFDGSAESLTANWTLIGSANWHIVEGAVQADRKTSKESAFLVSKRSFGDFELRVEFWVSDDANSGVFLRCADRDKITDRSCYEANIFDQRPDPTYGTGAITHIAKVSPMLKAGGRWNTYEITLRGPRLVLVLNGVKTVDIEDTRFASGPIALQYAQGVVKFRRVEIRPLP